MQSTPDSWASCIYLRLSCHIVSHWSYSVLLRKSRLKLTKLRKFLCHMLFSMNPCNCICTDLKTRSVYKFVFPLKHKVLGNLSIRKACYCLYTVCGSTIKPHDSCLFPQILTLTLKSASHDWLYFVSEHWLPWVLLNVYPCWKPKKSTIMIMILLHFPEQMSSVIICGSYKLGFSISPGIINTVSRLYRVQDMQQAKQ